MHKKQDDAICCPVETTLAYMGDKWNLLIVHHLLTGTKRFGELKESLGINPKTLTKHLRIMEENGIVYRTAYLEIPPRVEYTLTDLGYSLQPILDAIASTYSPIEIALAYMGNRWNLLIVHHLLTGAKRFGELKESLDVNPKTLTNHLRIMEQNGIVHRTAYLETPPRVEYSLTDLGHSLQPIIGVVEQWGEEKARIIVNEYSFSTKTTHKLRDI